MRSAQMVLCWAYRILECFVEDRMYVFGLPRMTSFRAAAVEMAPTGWQWRQSIICCNYRKQTCTMVLYVITRGGLITACRFGKTLLSLDWNTLFH